MKAWELLLSESQERMLMVVEKGREKEVHEFLKNGTFPARMIGEVTDDGILQFLYAWRTGSSNSGKGTGTWWWCAAI